MYTEVAASAAGLFTRCGLQLVRVDDPDDLIQLVAASSPQSRYLRFHTGMAQLRPTMAAHLANAEGRAIGLRTRQGTLVADARYTPTAEGEAEFAILVADDYQQAGLGTALLAVLFEHAAADGIKILNGAVWAATMPS